LRLPSLKVKAFVGLGQLLLVMGLTVFGAAGTIRWPHAWILLGTFFGSSLAITLHLMKNDPELLERRVQAGPAAEKRKSQKIVQLMASLAFLATIAVPGLDRRFGWSHEPLWLAGLGEALVAVGFLLVFIVFRTNRFSSAVIEVAAEQKVIDTGPYAWVRHPMYAGALVLLAGIPLSLGSYWGLLSLAPMAAAIVWRLLDEERFLSKELPGYEAYRRRTRFRLVPGVW